MKERWLNVFVIGSLALAISTEGMAATGNSVGQIVKIQGQVRIKRKGQLKRQPAKVNAYLYLGDRLTVPVDAVLKVRCAGTSTPISFPENETPVTNVCQSKAESSGGNSRLPVEAMTQTSPISLALEKLACWMQNPLFDGMGCRV